LRVVFANRKLQRLAKDLSYTWKYSREVASSYRLRVQMLESAQDVRDIPDLKSIHLEKLKGGRSHQWSMRLTGPWRLIARFVYSGRTRVAVMIEIVDYHR